MYIYGIHTPAHTNSHSLYCTLTFSLKVAANCLPNAASNGAGSELPKVNISYSLPFSLPLSLSSLHVCDVQMSCKLKRLSNKFHCGSIKRISITCECGLRSAVSAAKLIDCLSKGHLIKSWHVSVQK